MRHEATRIDCLISRESRQEMNQYFQACLHKLARCIFTLQATVKKCDTPRESSLFGNTEGRIGKIHKLLTQQQ